MTANEIEIATANTIVVNYGTENFPETDLYIWQPSLMKYRRIKMGQLVEIINGEIRRNEDIEYNDYEWDCPCLTLGG